MDVEIVLEFPFLEAEHGSQLFGHCSTYQRSCEIPNAMIRLHQGWQSGEVIIVGVGMEDSLDLADADAERIQDRWQVGAGID